MKRPVYRVKPIACPYCDHTLDALSPAADGTPPREPAAGDFSICLYCAQLLRFDENIEPARMTPAEEAAVARDHPEIAEQVRIAQAGVRTLDRT